MDRKVVNVREASGEFDVEILTDLISEGYSGQELLEKFIDIRNKIPMAVDMFLADIDEMVARGELPRYSSVDEMFDEIFGEDGE